MKFSKYQNVKALDIVKNKQWKLISFDDILTDETRKAIKIKKKDYLNNGKHPIIDQGKEFIAGYTNLDTIYENTPIIVFGDHTRILKYIDFPIFIGADGVKVLKNKYPEDEILTKYLYYYLCTVNIPDTGYNRHFKYLKEIVFPVTNIDTQKKIVELLDKANDLINKRKAQIEQLDKLTQSIFLDLFSQQQGKMVNLIELCEVNPQKREVSKLDDEMSVSFLPMASVSDKGEIDLTESRKIREVYKGFTYFRENDILFAKITPCMENGKGAIAKNLLNGIGFGSTEFHVLRPKESITSEWLYYLTTLPNFRLQAENNMTGSAGQKRVPKQFFDKYKIAKPSVESQMQFKKIVLEIEEQKEKLKNSLGMLETNFHALLQRVFRGELLNDEYD